MRKLKMSASYQAVLVCLVILVVAGGYFVYNVYLPPGDLRQNQPQDIQSTHQTTPVIPTLAQPASPAMPVPGSTQDPESICSPQAAAPHIPVPIDTSIPVRDPMPGVRYSIYENESGRMIVLEKGEIVEINLRWAPGVAWTWDIPVSGCSLELVNDGYYSGGGDFWNKTGHYRARYRGISPGKSIIDGIFGVPPRGTATKENPRFNLTVIVK
ncbi:MAG: hypothetical protein WCH85_09340 [Methanomicrobiales archaeon]